MRLKTYLATYLLFLFILLLCFGVVSVYMTNTQMKMNMEKSAREYQTIAATLAKDIINLSGVGRGFSEELNRLVDGYATYYRKNNIRIDLIDLSLAAQEDYGIMDTEISFLSDDQEHFIYITGILPDTSHRYRLDYYYNITEIISDMRSIQNILLLICIAFSVITAFALYFILLGIFRPLAIVSKASKKIADGHYSERIYVNGKNELSAVAEDFNRMAEEIERQICVLEDEAAGKQQFIDNFTHEIRTPLTSIYGYAEYMQKAPLNEDEMIESTQFIMDEASHMKKIANSLLELATLRNDTPVKSEISIPRLFHDIYQTMKKPLQEKKLQLICEPGTDVLDGQEDLVKSLLLNLCFNSLKSCTPNDGVIRLEAKMQGESIVLSVTDNGYGIPEESIPKLTEPFYRVDKARSRKHGGAGLGLALCKQIAEAHGAEMTVDSTVGKGTAVKIFFTTP